MKYINEKINLISSLLSLFLLLLLLICTCYGWYTNNTVVKASNIVGVASEGVIEQLTLKRYLAYENENGTYSIYNDIFDEEVDIDKEENNDKVPVFSLLKPNSKIIYRITFYTSLDNIKITMKTHNSQYVAGLKNDSGKYYNYLSNVCSFSYLTGTDRSLSVTNYEDNETVKSFITKTSEDEFAKQTDVELLSIDTSNNTGLISIYFLFDYSIVSVE